MSSRRSASRRAVGRAALLVLLLLVVGAVAYYVGGEVARRDRDAATARESRMANGLRVLLDGVERELPAIDAAMGCAWRHGEPYHGKGLLAETNEARALLNRPTVTPRTVEDMLRELEGVATAK